MKAGSRVAIVTCMDDRTGPASVGLEHFGSHLVFIRTRGAVAPLRWLVDRLNQLHVGLVVLTWHHSRSSMGGNCAAHLGDPETALSACYALARKVRAHGLMVVCAEVNTDTGEICYDARQLLTLPYPAFTSLEELQELNAEYVAHVKAGATHAKGHAATYAYYAEIETIRRLRVCHGEALVINPVMPEEDVRALDVAASVLQQCGLTPTAHVVTLLNGSMNAARRACEELALNVRRSRFSDVMCRGIDQTGRLVAL